MKSKRPIQFLLVVLVLGLIFVFYQMDLAQFLTLETLKARQREFQEYAKLHFSVACLAFASLYILLTALSLPGAAILTLAGGASFGLFWGTLLASFSSSIGATVAFLSSRFLFRDFVARKFHGPLEKINQGLDREGAFYLFSLRLIPIFPFFAINLAMGLTKMKTLTFFWVSQAGMLLATLAFTNAGTQLAGISDLKDILSPQILVSLAILGFIPFIAKCVLHWWKGRKMLGRFKKPKRFDYNVVVIGAGSGGLFSSFVGTTVKAKVALIEKDRMGGDCLNTGCVPSKTLIRTARVFGEARKAERLGVRKVTIDFEFSEIMGRVQQVISEIAPHDSEERYTKLGVDVFRGDPKILSPYEVQINGKVLTTRNIIIATGASPFIPKLPGIENVGPLSSDNIRQLKKLPGRLLVLGGGTIGSELTQCFARFGSHVIQVEGGKRLLPREDPDISEFVMKVFREEGVEIRTGLRATRFELRNGKKVLIAHQGEREELIEFDEVLVAVGRRANISGFGLEELGVRISDKGHIEADAYMRTNYPNIYVCGDVVGPYQFTHMAAHQAWYATVNSLFSPFRKFKTDYSIIPWCTFTDPEISRVGHSEDSATHAKLDFEVTRYPMDNLDRAIAEGENRGFIKILTQKGCDRILGVTIVGAHAGETLLEFVTAMKFGIGLNKILGTIHSYPTFGEANRYAAGAWKKAHASQALLRWAEKFHAWRRKERLLPF